MNAPNLKKKIVIVDDDPEVLKVLSIVLERAGYEVLKANYSLQALFRVARMEPDLVLADLGMPIMDGFDLIRQLKGHRETAGIPVVVLTGNITAESRQAAFDAGCAAYLIKPFDAEVLTGQLAKQLKSC